MERRGQGRAQRRAVRLRGGPDARDRAHPGAARAAGGRGVAAVRRAPGRRLARERGDSAAVAQRPVPDDPPLSPRGLLAARAGGQRHAVGARGGAAGAGGGGPGVDPRERRHRLGQDHHPQRAVGRHSRRGADRDDRGRRRAGAAPAPRGAPGGAPAQPGGQRRGDDPPARAQRAAHAPGPDRGGRGPRRRGAGPAPGAEHRARRLAVHGARQLARPTPCAGWRRSR